MAIRDIVKDGDNILRKVCRDVVDYDSKLHKMLDDMYQTMLRADGVGLAAPQIGILRNVAVVDADGVFLEMINPKIIFTSGEQVGVEGCLSVPNKNCKVKRPLCVTVEYYNRYGEKKVTTASDLPAVAICHETDHLNGILFYDKEFKEEGVE